MHRVHILYKNGSFYEGLYSIEKDQYEDFGILSIVMNTNQKIIYEGYFHKGLFEGKGELKIEDHYIYEGEFLRNAKHGFGKEKKSGSFIYEGQFFKNSKQGFGKIITNDIISKGYLKQNKFHGIVEVLFLKSKDLFKGICIGLIKWKGFLKIIRRRSMEGLILWMGGFMRGSIRMI